MVRSARSIGSGCSSPAASSPSPIRTASWISSVRFHRASDHVKTTRRNEFDPRSTTAWRRSGTSAPFDELDPVAIRIAHEADPRPALTDAVRRLLRVDALRGQVVQRAVEVVDGKRDVVVAGAELV